MGLWGVFLRQRLSHQPLLGLNLIWVVYILAKFRAHSSEKGTHLHGHEFRVLISED